MSHSHLVSVGILALGLTIIAPGPTGQAAPLPPPKKMSLPPPVEHYLRSMNEYKNSKKDRIRSKPEEKSLSKSILYDYYDDIIDCLKCHLDGGPRWKMDRPLTIEEQRGLRDLLYRLQREMAEGQANGTLGHEGYHEAWRKHQEAQRQKQK